MLYGINELYRAVNSIKPDTSKCYYHADSGNICYIDDNNEVPLIRFLPFKKYNWLSLGFSTRLGGISKGYFASLNLGFGRGDASENVIENYKRATKAMNGSYKNLVLSGQVHGTKVIYADKTHKTGEGLLKRLEGIDGMVTKEPGLILATSYADCVPLFFADNANKIIASSHSGWRGTTSFIGSKTVKKMQEYGSRPEDIECIIGPSICQDCYEVSKDVIDEIKKAYPENTWKDIFYCKDQKENKYQLDLWAANFHQLLLAGLKKENIHVSGLCTCCNNMVLFSHRASKGRRGNLNGFIMINSQ